jgi:hypothetical protein
MPDASTPHHTQDGIINDGRRNPAVPASPPDEVHTPGDRNPPGVLHPPGDRYPPCPITTLAYQTLSSAHSLNHMLRRLRLSMANCCSCRSRDHCPILVDFNTQLTTALQEIADEWRLS